MVGTGRVGERFEHASGDLERPVDVAVLALLGLSHIKQHRAGGDLRRSVLRRHNLHLAPGLGHQLCC